MIIRFLQRWRNHDAGEETSWPGGSADILVRRKIAEMVSDDPPKPSIAQRIVKAVSPEQKAAARAAKVKTVKGAATCRRKW